ncbi:MAG TPA: Ig-like domain-containing protein, partial [Gemmatimonadaceae bacterium]|nr:Ig-like domain-containing protein [Gemmatimonadaceae bacterium]
MLPLRLIPFAVAGLAAVAATTAPLRVIRSTPVGVGDPVTEITVSFDRPVAGSIERAIDPSLVMRLSPAIEGRYEWRDPVTVRFVPARRLPADLRVVVTVGTDFEAMDGTRLAEP